MEIQQNIIEKARKLMVQNKNHWERQAQHAKIKTKKKLPAKYTLTKMLREDMIDL